MNYMAVVSISVWRISVSFSAFAAALANCWQCCFYDAQIECARFYID